MDEGAQQERPAWDLSVPEDAGEGIAAAIVNGGPDVFGVHIPLSGVVLTCVALLLATKANNLESDIDQIEKGHRVLERSSKEIAMRRRIAEQHASYVPRERYPFVVQSIRLNKNEFEDIDEARKWLRSRGHRYDSCVEKPTSWYFKQRSRSLFSGKLRSKRIDDEHSIRGGRLR